jgi:DoxX.
MALTPLQTGEPTADLVILLARVLFGATIAFMGLNHFMQGASMAEYAGYKGVPAPGVLVPLTGGMIVFGGLGIVLGFYPTLAAGALLVFLLVTTPVMHNFWAVGEDEQQAEMINFLKNVLMIGGALVFFGLAGAPEGWAYALNIGL